MSILSATKPVASSPLLLKSKKQRRRNEILKAYLFLLPISVFIILFSYYPFFKTLIYSFSTVNVRGEIVRFVGLDNYFDIAKRGEFLNSVKVSFRYTLMYLPLAVTFPLILALVAARRKPFSNVYQTFFAMPMAVSTSAACLIFQQFYHRRNGFLNFFLNQTGIMANRTDINWLQDKTWALPALALIVLWVNIGFNFMLLLAAVRNVPEELLESASLEGAGYWRKVFHIIIPSISPTLFFVICTQAITALTMNQPAMILTKGEPLGSTSTMVYYVYTSGFRSTNYTLGSTASICTFLITLVFLLLNFLYEKKGVHYD